MNVVADLPADAQAAEPVQQRDRSFHDPAVHAQAGVVPGAAPGEVRGDLEPRRRSRGPRASRALVPCVLRRRQGAALHRFNRRRLLGRLARMRFSSLPSFVRARSGPSVGRTPACTGVPFCVRCFVSSAMAGEHPRPAGPASPFRLSGVGPSAGRGSGGRQFDEQRHHRGVPASPGG
jgi:hypothetical protein